jgi:hypothetical protein
MRARMIRRRNERSQLSIDRQAQPEEIDPAVWTLVIALAIFALLLLYWVTG